jgi:hypothetical protein
MQYNILTLCMQNINQKIRHIQPKRKSKWSFKHNENKLEKGYPLLCLPPLEKQASNKCSSISSIYHFGLNW